LQCTLFRAHAELWYIIIKYRVDVLIGRCFQWGIQKHESESVSEPRHHHRNHVKLLENKKTERELSEADHRLIGQQLDLFSIGEDVGTGLVLWHPKGTIIRNLIRDFWEREHRKNGYQLVTTPHIARERLWQISGHLDYYRRHMYVFKKAGEGYVVKPMNCPFHVQIYKAKPRSYRDLPIRYAEWGTVYRYEPSGTLCGLLRVRGFTQDDAHIFCTEEQVQREVLTLLNFTEKILKSFGFNEYSAVLSTRDPKRREKYMGPDFKWNQAQEALALALETRAIDYREAEGEAVFYGPKIDMDIVDASGREWQCTTIQFDFNLPNRFNVCYVGADGCENEVIMIHRALLGTIERFFAILIEHCSGNFPTWLAPVQVAVLPVSEESMDYARHICQEMLRSEIRAELDESQATIGYKIRNAEIQKIPYMAVVGKREAKTHMIAVRKHRSGDIGSMTIEQLVARIKQEDKASPCPEDNANPNNPI